VKNKVLKAVGTVSKKWGFLKNGSHDFFKNTYFGMWKWSPKTPHTQFLCRVQFHKLPLKTHRALKLFSYLRKSILGLF
jgi:hypothetical protein